MEMDLRQYVRTLLVKYGHTQKSVAAAMRIDEGQMSRLLDSSPRPVTLDALCEAIGCDADERLEIYRQAGKVPMEIVNAFCASVEGSRRIRAAANGE
jgi:DNA-binding Xre family transcriptional regulator